MCKAYFSSVTWVDYLLGQLLSRLQDLGHEDDTVVVFAGDHGWQVCVCVSARCGLSTCSATNGNQFVYGVLWCVFVHMFRCLSESFTNTSVSNGDVTCREPLNRSVRITNQSSLLYPYQCTYC